MLENTLPVEFQSLNVLLNMQSSIVSYITLSGPQLTVSFKHFYRLHFIFSHIYGFSHICLLYQILFSGWLFLHHLTHYWKCVKFTLNGKIYITEKSWYHRTVGYTIYVCYRKKRFPPWHRYNWLIFQQVTLQCQLPSPLLKKLSCV